jgi:hypothetical protein
MNTHQHVFRTITMTSSNVFVLGIQAMNPIIVHTTIPINYHTTWSQPVMPIILSKTSMLPTSTCPMWYNVIPLLMPLDPSLYLAYPTGTKGFDYSIFNNHTSYVPRNVYPIPEQLVVPLTYIPNFIGNQFCTMVQIVISMDIQLVQQLVIASVPTIIQVISILPTYVPIRSNHQPPN